MKKFLIISMILLHISLNAEIYRLERVYLSKDDIALRKTYTSDKFIEYELRIDAPDADLTTGIQMQARLISNEKEIPIDSIIPARFQDGLNVVKFFISDSLISDTNIQPEFNLEFFNFMREDNEEIIHDKYAVLHIDSIEPSDAGAYLNSSIFEMVEGSSYAVPPGENTVSVEKLSFKTDYAFETMSSGEEYSLRCQLKKKPVFSKGTFMLYTLGTALIEGFFLTVFFTSFYDNQGSVPLNISPATSIAVSAAFVGIASFFPNWSLYNSDRKRVAEYNDGLSPFISIEKVEK